MAKTGTEEKSPLLFGLDSNDDILKPKKNQYFEQRRFGGILNGVTVVFARFPDIIGTCWITTAACSLLFFMFVLLICSTLTNNNIRVPRCIPLNELNSQTVHLVHAHSSNHWLPREFEIIDKISKKYSKYTIHIILIQPETSVNLPRYRRGISRHLTSVSDINKMSYTELQATTTKKVTVKRKKRKIDDVNMNINFEAKRLLDMLLHGKLADNITNKSRSLKPATTSITTTTTTSKPIASLEDLKQLYPNIILENTTYNQAFFNSPLYAYWPYLNDDLKVFAVRILQLWQYGGISFDLDPHIDKLKSTNLTKLPDNDNDIFNTRVLKFVISEKGDYEELPVAVVTADENALHMESKIPCHAFFGQILINLRKAQSDTTVKDIMQASIKVFCEHFAGNKKYCDTFMKLH